MERYEDRCTTFKIVRNRFLTGCEKITLALNILLFLFGLMMIVAGINFIDNC